MVRLLILLVLLGLTIWEWVGGERRQVYWLALVGLFAFFSLRYGQGTDYITYMSIYANIPPLQTLPYFGAFQYNRVEIGFFYLVSFFKMLGAHYVLFIAFVNAFALWGIHRFISRFSTLPVFSLTVFFAVYSLVYMESAIRQILTMAIAMGWVYVDWRDGKHVRAMICMVIAAFFHTAAAVLFLIPLLLWRERPLFVLEWKPRTTAIVVGVLVICAVLIQFVDFSPLFRVLPDTLEDKILSYYNAKSQISLMALANRTLFMLITGALAWRAKGKLSQGERLLFNLYCIGYAIYLLLMPFDELASRTNVYFRVVDICLIPLLFERNRDFVGKTRVALPVMLMLLSFLYVKDITAVMQYAQYYNSNPLQYPYITVFNGDALFDAKFINVKNANAMNAYRASGKSWDEYYDTLLRKPSVRSPIVPY